MKFLGDVGVSVSTLKALREAGYDSVHLREQNLHRLPDQAILLKAIEERRIVITLIWISVISSRLGEGAVQVLLSSVLTIKPRRMLRKAFLIFYL